MFMYLDYSGSLDMEIEKRKKKKKFFKSPQKKTGFAVRAGSLERYGPVRFFTPSLSD